MKIEFSERLIEVLNILEQDNNYIAFELLYLKDYSDMYDNPQEIEKIDVGKRYSFTVTIGKAKYEMKVGRLIKYFFNDLYTNSEISEFIDGYNDILDGNVKTAGNKVEIPKFIYNPKDVRSTFLNLVSKTYPHGHEEEVLKFLPKLNKDKFGNYYKIMGGNQTPSTMFTSHLDTADRNQSTPNILSREVDGEEILYTDGSTILGADDKAGVSVMLYMMENNVPGLYYFFIGEERGGIGSNNLASEFESFSYLSNVKRCVSFDRRKTTSVIISQLGRSCCSREFATALCQEYNSNGMQFSMDPNGVYTDSASFIDQIPECTNISVGYENEHTGKELQNITYLTKVAEASTKINWDNLPTHRSVSLNQELITKYRELIRIVKKTYFDLEIKFTGDSNNNLYLTIDLDDSNIVDTYDSILKVQTLLKKFKLNDRLVIEDSCLKIELK
jgi:hypothetical protein